MPAGRPIRPGSGSGRTRSAGRGGRRAGGRRGPGSIPGAGELPAAGRSLVFRPVGTHRAAARAGARAVAAAGQRERGGCGDGDGRRGSSRRDAADRGRAVRLGQILTAAGWPDPPFASHNGVQWPGRCGRRTARKTPGSRPPGSRKTPGSPKPGRRGPRGRWRCLPRGAARWPSWPPSLRLLAAAGPGRLGSAGDIEAALRGDPASAARLVQARRPAGHRGGPVRGGVHRLPRGGRAAALIGAVCALSGPAVVVLALRADFYGRSRWVTPELAAALQERQGRAGPDVNRPRCAARLFEPCRLARLDVAGRLVEVAAGGNWRPTAGGSAAGHGLRAGSAAAAVPRVPGHLGAQPRRPSDDDQL